MMGTIRSRRGERGFSAVAVILTIGVVVGLIGLSVLFSTDAQLRGATLAMVTRNSDWTVRSSIKLVEEAWLKYIGIAETGPNEFSGTLYEDVDRHSRDDNIELAMNLAGDSAHPNSNYSLLPLLYETENTTIDLGNFVMPESLIYQVDLRKDRPGFANFQQGSDASDGIVFVAYQRASDHKIVAVESVDNTDGDETYETVWNSLDAANDDRRFNAIITVTPNGMPHTEEDEHDVSFYVFPVKFELTVTIRYKDTSQKIVRGLGSCAFYIRQRNFCEYLVFSDIFTTESGGSIVIPRGFTYAGPVHTNTRFSFTGDPQGAVFKDRVTQHYQRAIWNGDEEPSDGWKDRLSYNGCTPTFEKSFAKGVSAIAPPDVDDLNHIPSAVLGNASPPSENGVYLSTAGNTLNQGNTLGTGGIYIKGDVESLTLTQGNRTQTYTITQKVDPPIVEEVISTTTTYYNSNNCTQTAYPNLTTQRRSMKVVQVSRVTTGYRYIITSDYSSGNTTWNKTRIECTQTVTTKHRRNSGTQPFSEYSSSTGTSAPTYIPMEDITYVGLPDVVAETELAQTAIYIDGALGQGEPGISNTPTGLSGTVDKETQLTICAKNSVIIAGDTTYESKAEDAENILGILSVTEKVCIDYPNPVGKDVHIDASIFAVNDGDGTLKKGVLTALDYQYNLNNPNIYLYGGVIQKYYGAVGQSTTPKNGYSRQFEYDPRLRYLAPPLYPVQSACRMRLTNVNDSNTLHLVWDL